MALCLPVLAQGPGDPADAESPAAALRYPSAFTDYQPWTELSVRDWRAANDAVSAGAAAGVHSGPAAAPAPARPAGAAEKRAPPASAPAHEGHDMQGGQK
ncbi:MAG: hypothetical protein JWQ33_3166 [Ramlibacter sp.]|nr:hypothetical protein [Ramlibacter sp.]